MSTPCFNVMVKPAGPDCNLNCSYCYYLCKKDLLRNGRPQRISEDLLEQFTRHYLEEYPGDNITFSWQGGEPTLMGLDFFRKALNLQQQFRRPGQKISNDLQTNGTLLNEEWCAFLRNNDFLVGLSVDGPPQLHDVYRRDRRNQPTCDRVITAAKMLHQYRVEFNTLTVVNRTNARYPLDVYKFLKNELGAHYMQFIPGAEPKEFAATAPQYWLKERHPRLGEAAARPGTPESVVTEWSVDPDDYGKFLCAIFDRWYANDIGRVFVITFEDSLKRWLGRPSALCCFAETCGRNVVLEHNGDVYACDHYVYPEYLLGNIREQPLAAMVFSRRQQRFGLDKSASLPRYCRECPYFFACYGECPRNRFIRTPDGEPGLNYLCAGLRKYFAHIDGPLKSLAARLARGAYTNSQSKIGNVYT